MQPLLEQKPWCRIRPAGLFARAFVENGTVAWPGKNDDCDARADYGRWPCLFYQIDDQPVPEMGHEPRDELAFDKRHKPAGASDGH
jgi:hypothetical protein